MNDNARPTWNVTVPNNAIFGGVNWVHVFSPNLLNEAAVGGTKQDAFIPCAKCSVPPIGVVGITGFGEGFAPAGFAEADMHWREMLSLTHGRHTLRGGIEVFHNQDFAKFTETDVRPNYTFLSVFDFASDAPEFQSVNFDPRTGGIQNGNKYWLSSDYGTFVQDDWKAKPNLSLNMGLRWEFPSNPSEAHGNRGRSHAGSGQQSAAEDYECLRGSGSQRLHERAHRVFCPTLRICLAAFGAPRTFGALGLRHFLQPWREHDLERHGSFKSSNWSCDHSFDSCSDRTPAGLWSVPVRLVFLITARFRRSL